MNRDSFIFYRSFFEGLQSLEPLDRCAVYDAICEYSMNFKEIELTGVSKAIFTLIKPQLDANNRKWENGKKGAEHGHKGGQTNPKRTPKKPQANPKPTPNVNENVNVNVNENVNDNENNSPTLFDIFWKVYDFNVGMRQAQDEWMRITKEMPNEIPKIMANVPLYVASKQDKNFRKKPENYLKERVWMDEIVIDQPKPEPKKYRMPL